MKAFRRTSLLIVLAAVVWKDLDAYKDWMVERLLSPTVQP
jgi:hypothetical protein